MRFFAVEGGERRLGLDGPLRVVAEYVPFGGRNPNRGGPAVDGDRERHFSEEELLATEEGTLALQAWRAGDDSAWEEYDDASSAADQLEDDIFQAGMDARPDLHARLGPDLSDEEHDQVVGQIRRAGAEALGLPS
jgi:hypothetical protein